MDAITIFGLIMLVVACLVFIAGSVYVMYDIDLVDEMKLLFTQEDVYKNIHIKHQHKKLGIKKAPRKEPSMIILLFQYLRYKWHQSRSDRHHA